MSGEKSILYEASSTKYMKELMFEISRLGEQGRTTEKTAPGRGNSIGTERHQGRSPAVNYDRESWHFELLGG